MEKAAEEEFTTQPTGYWFQKDNPNNVLLVEASGSLEYNGNTANWEMTGEGQMSVDDGSGAQTWTFNRNGIDLEITFPGQSAPTTFTMQ